MEEHTKVNTKLSQVEPILGVDIVLFILATLSCLVNGIIVYLIIFKRKKNVAIDLILILIIALLDTIASVYLIINQIIKWILGKDVIHTNIYCNFSIMIFCSATFISIVITGLLSIVRYLIIVKNYRINNKYFIIFFTLLMIFLYIIVSLATFAGEPRVMTSAIYCIPTRKKSILPLLFTIVVLIFIVPCIIMIPIFYLLVLNHYRKLVTNINNLNETYPYKTVFKRRLFDSTFIRFLLIIFAYLITLFPEFILVVYTIIKREKRSPLGDGITITLLFSVTLVNGLFVLTLHEESKVNFLRLIGLSSRIPTSSHDESCPTSHIY